MKHLRFLLLAALVAMPLTGCDEDTNPVVIDTIYGTVTGTVSAEGSGLSGVSVTLVGGSSQSATTGAGGTYTFTNVEAGSYGIAIDASTHADVSFSQTSKTTTITTSGETATVDFTGSFIRTATITGVVTASGTPLGGIAVVVTGGPDNVTKNSVTNAGGEYFATGLRGGNYTVTITAPTGVTFATTAAQVTVGTGETKTAQFPGEAVQMATISGAVTVDGVPAVGVTVILSGGADATTETGANGAYAFVNLTPGIYTVTVTPPEGATFEPAFKTLTVAAGQTGVASFAGLGEKEPATVSIKSITRSFFFDEIPVDLDNVFDQIEVTLNITRNDYTLKYVDIVFTDPGELAGPEDDVSVVMATQVFQGSASPAEMAGNTEEVELSVQTTQLKPGTSLTPAGAVVWVPAAHNGAWELSANLVVEEITEPIPTNKKVIVLQNEDVLLAGTAFGGDLDFHPVQPERNALDDDDDVWYAGFAELTGHQFVSYSTIVPENVEFYTDGCGYPDDVTITGDAASGILITNLYECENVEYYGVEAYWWETYDFSYPDNPVGPDGTAVRFYDSYIAAIGAQYYLSNPAAPVGPRRYIIAPENVQDGQISEPDELNMDNRGPDTDLNTVAFDPTMGYMDDYFSEYWVKDDFDFVEESVVAEDGGVGHDIEKAFLWAGTDLDDDDCTMDTEVVTPLASGLTQTLTSDDAETGGSYAICGYAEDRLGNYTLTSASNSFGVDWTPPMVRLHDRAPASVGDLAPTESATTPISWAMDENVFGTADMFGDGDFHYDVVPDAAMLWGLEAIDDRAGLENMDAYNGTTDDHWYYPFQQKLWYMNADGATILMDWTVDDDDVGDLCGTPTDYAFMAGGALGDNWRDVANGMAFQCGEIVPAIYDYMGRVIDRAGNIATVDDLDDATIAFNWIYDVDEGGVINAVTLTGTSYEAGMPGSFNLYGSDDLEVIGVQFGVTYNTYNGYYLWAYDPQLIDPAVDRWDDDFTFALLAPVTVTTQEMIWNRIDWTVGSALPADSAAYYAGSVADQDGNTEVNKYDMLPDEVYAWINEDAGYNPFENTESMEFVDYIFGGWSASSPTEAPWADANLLTLEFDPDVTPDPANFIVEHTGLTSVDEWYFDRMFLVLLDIDDDAFITCDETSTYVYTDNGTNRFYTYTFEVPADDTMCGMLAADNTDWEYHAVGVKGGSLLVTDEYYNEGS